MNNAGSVELIRDCDATQIPSGEKVRLSTGTQVYISQSLGGSYTVQAPGGLYRISNNDADALGFARSTPETASHVSTGAAINEDTVWTALKSCFDPEIPVNIVDLGLVYDLQITPLSSGQSRVAVKMTLTAPGCGMGATIAGDAQEKLLNLPGVAEATVDIVWDPPWHHSMITPTGRKILGLDS